MRSKNSGSATSSNAKAEIEKLETTRRVIIMHLSRLWGHYWRPDMPTALADEVLIDWVNDLRDYDLIAVSAACDRWRRSPKEFFPKPGQLIPLVIEEQRELRAKATHATLPPFRRSTASFRPSMWWSLPQHLWQPHWHDDEIPAEYRDTVMKIRAKREAEAAQ